MTPRQLHSLNLHFGLDMNFSKNKLLKFISGGDSCRKQYGFQPWIYLNWEYISISLYSHLWLYFAFLDHIWHIRHHWYIRCNPKTYAIRFSVWQAIFWAKFQTYRPTFGTGLGWFTSIFGYFYNNIWVKYFSVQRCNAPNAPKISILIFRICIKLNLGFILAILWYFWTLHIWGGHGAPPHPENWNSKSDPRVCQPNTNSFFDINWVSCENFSQIDQL